MPAAAATATSSEEILLAIQVNAEKSRAENALMMQNMAQMFGISRQESLDREGILRG
jgi:hypothetical protein